MYWTLRNDILKEEDNKISESVKCLSERKLFTGI